MSNNSQREFEKGNKLYTEKNYSSALTCYENCLRNHYNESSTYLKIINCYLKLNQKDKALETSKEAYTSTRNSQFLIQKATIQIQLFEYNEAERDLRFLLDKYNRTKDWKQFLFCLFFTRKFKEAKEIIDNIQTSGQFVNEPNIIVPKIMILFQLGLYDQVIEEKNDSIKNDKVALFYLGYSYIKLNKKDAMKKINNLLTDKENYVELNNTLYFIYNLKIKHYNKAEEYANKKVNFPIKGMEEYYKAILYIKMNKPKGEINHFLIKSLTNNPKYLEAYIKLANQYNQINQDENILQIFQIGENLYNKEDELPFNIRFVLSYAKIIFTLNKKDDSIQKAYNFIKYSRTTLRKREIYERYSTDDLIKTIQSYLELNCYYYGYKKDDLIVYINKPIYMRKDSEFYQGELKGNAVCVKVTSLLPYVIQNKEEKQIVLINTFLKISTLEILMELGGVNAGIIRFYSAFCLGKGNLIYTVTELCNGGNLYQFINEPKVKIGDKEKIAIAKKIICAFKFTRNANLIQDDITLANFIFKEKFDSKGNNDVFLTGINPGIPEKGVSRFDIFILSKILWQLFAKIIIDENIKEPLYANNLIISKVKSISNIELSRLIYRGLKYNVSNFPQIEEYYSCISKI